MTSNEIRSRFLKFFASKDHSVIESDSLVPKNDPTVLFTTAGMQQFKRQFLGHLEGYTRATTSQKCLRTDDLDVVGKTNFHHTFFEMLGNFSFGDYFKQEAIEWAWEFLTKDLGIPKEKLWVSVYKEDGEAEQIWLKTIKVDPKKLVKLGDHSNFWPADAKEKGPNGPCGPCSEIFYDYGVNPDCSNKKCDPDCDCGRFSEVWNLVFTQFNRKDGGALEPLPNKNIDTGMGLERLTAVIQGKKSNYETDLFTPILKAIDEKVLSDEKSVSQTDKYVIADHIRAVVFGINDGVVPSNEDRGYVIKRLIIDIVDIVLRGGQSRAGVDQLVDVVAETMSKAYPELKGQTKNICGFIKKVEQSYIKVRQERLPELKKQIKSLKSSGKALEEELGAVFFKFRDTYGLTLPTIIEEVKNLNVDEKTINGALKKFNELMSAQQDQSRASSKMTGDVFTGSINLNVPKTNFLGYEHAESTSTILKIFIGSEKVNDVKKGDQIQIILDKTPFYAESGGQIGDAGIITHKSGIIKVTDTQKTDDVFVHTGIVEEGTFKIDQQVTATIDVDRRLSIMRNHTATHLLQSALRTVLGTHVQQQGSLVEEGRLRFDFTHHEPIAEKDLAEIESMVNLFIRACDTVTIDYLSIDEARKSGALAFFAEKYGTTVRVVTIGNYSKEFCGGTHLGSTGQIGLFKIVNESAIAQGIRRLEAKTGVGALEETNRYQSQLNTLAKTLKSPVDELPQRVQTQSKRIKDLEKQLQQYRFEAIKGTVDGIITKAKPQNGTSVITHIFDDADMSMLRKANDLIKQKVKSAVAVLGANNKEGASLLIMVGDPLIKKGLNANELINEVAPIIEGSGGGRADLAQAGSKKPAKLKDAIAEAERLIKDKIK